jgi:hypothetical protein
MKERSIEAMPPCFEKWCARFDDLFRTKAEKREFRHYLAGLLGESKQKNLSEIARNSVGVTYNRLHHFATDAKWSPQQINERRLQVMNHTRQTKIQRGFSLIIDDSGHRKSGNFTAGVGRQYVGEVGKIDNSMVVVTSHLYDGKKSLPLDVELYQHRQSLAQGKQDPQFKKKPEIALELVDRTLARKYQPGIVLIDSGYGNNTTFLSELEHRGLTYLGGVAKNRKVKAVKAVNADFSSQKLRLDELANSLSAQSWKPVQSNGKPSTTLWVAIVEVKVSQLKGTRTIAIVMNDSCFSNATEVDYLITNFPASEVTPEWVINTYSQRNWVEVFYREVKGNLGWRECQLRGKTSLLRHFVLVFCAYTLIVWHTLTGGLRRKWSQRPLNTFSEALEAFRTAIIYRFVKWLQSNWDVYCAHKERFGYILA